MIKVIALDLVGVLVKENDFVLDKTDEKLEKLFRLAKSDFEFSSRAATILPSMDTNSLKERCKHICSSKYSLRVTQGELSKFKEQHKDIKIVIATNHVSCVRDFITKAFGADLFDEIFISTEIEAAKPDIAFYEKMLEKLQVGPTELCLVDDFEENLESAKQIGITNVIHVTKSSNITNLLEATLNK